jgi:hypothetical protein
MGSSIKIIQIHNNKSEEKMLKSPTQEDMHRGNDYGTMTNQSQKSQEECCFGLNRCGKACSASFFAIASEGAACLDGEMAREAELDKQQTLYSGFGTRNENQTLRVLGDDMVANYYQEETRTDLKTAESEKQDLEQLKKKNPNDNCTKAGECIGTTLGSAAYALCCLVAVAKCAADICDVDKGNDNDSSPTYS